MQLLTSDTALQKLDDLNEKTFCHVRKTFYMILLLSIQIRGDCFRHCNSHVAYKIFIPSKSVLFV